ncbi:hypothetical protein ABK040_002055 [Willaertia magna]
MSTHVDENFVEEAITSEKLKKRKLEKNEFSILLNYDPNILFHIFSYCHPFQDFPTLSCISKDWFNEFFNNPNKIIQFYKEWINYFWKNLKHSLNTQPQVFLEIFENNFYSNETFTDELQGEFEINLKYLHKLFYELNKLKSCKLELLFDNSVFYISNKKNGILISNLNGNIIRMKEGKTFINFYGGWKEDKLDYIASNYWLEFSIKEKGFLYEQLKQMLKYMELNQESTDNGFELLQFMVGSENVNRKSLRHDDNEDDEEDEENEDEEEEDDENSESLLKFDDEQYECYSWDEGEASEKLHLMPWNSSFKEYFDLLNDENDRIEMFDDRIVTDKDFVLNFLSPRYPKLSEQLFENISHDLLDEDYILKSLKKFIGIFPHISSTISYNPEFILKAIKANGEVLKYILKSNEKDDKKENKEKIEKDNKEELDFTTLINVDRDIIKMAIESNPNAYCYLKKQDKLDKEYLTLAIKNHSGLFRSKLYNNIPLNMFNELDIALTILKVDPFYTIQRAKLLLKNKETALILVKRSPYVIRWLENDLRSDEEIIIESIKTHFDALRHVNQQEQEKYLSFAKESMKNLLQKEKHLLIIFKQSDSESLIKKIIKITEPKLQLMFLIEQLTIGFNQTRFIFKKNYGPFIEEIGADATLTVIEQGDDDKEVKTIDDVIKKLPEVYCRHYLHQYMETKPLLNDEEVRKMLKEYYPKIE